MDRLGAEKTERDFSARLSAEAAQYRAECDANVAAYKKQLNAAAEQERAARDEERRYYNKVIDVQRAKGLITPDEYKLIRSCLHPDSRASVTDEKLAAAFRLFNDERIKVLLVKEISESPNRRPRLPSSTADLKRKTK